MSMMKSQWNNFQTCFTITIKTKDVIKVGLKFLLGSLWCLLCLCLLSLCQEVVLESLPYYSEYSFEDMTTAVAKAKKQYDNPDIGNLRNVGIINWGIRKIYSNNSKVVMEALHDSYLIHAFFLRVLQHCVSYVFLHSCTIWTFELTSND